VTVHFEGSDGLSGVATITPDMIISTEGANQSAQGTVWDRAGNAATYTLSGINLDRTPPVITLAVPAAGGTYSLRASVPTNWSAVDGNSGTETVSSTTPSGGPLDTAAPGDHNFQVVATDLAGNKAEKLVVYHVHYVCSGVLPPLAGGKSIFKLGSTIPVKVQLTDATGALVTNAIVVLSVGQVAESVDGIAYYDAVSTAAATTGNLFRCDAAGSQYIFNLSTKPLRTGTWMMRISLNDGSSDFVQFSLR
jgi:hypothetical protein